MVALNQVVILARMIGGLLAGRDGEDVVAEVRAAPVAEAAPILRSVVLTVVLTCLAFGFAREGNTGVGLTAAFHDIRTLVDL